MAEYKEQATYMFNNFELKRWLHGNENRRRMLLVKLKNDLRKLGLSKRATRAGLVQLAMKPCVILKRLSVSCCRKKLLPSSHSNFIPIHKEKMQTNHRDDVENNRLEDNSQDIVQHTFDAQIPNTASGITLINAVNANKTCQSKIQECDLVRKESSDGTKQDFNQKVITNISYIDVTSTNYTDIFAKKSAIEASPSFSSSEDESLNKHIQNVVHEFINKSLDATMLFQLEEHSDSKSSIDSLKDVFREKHREKKDYKIKQEFFSVKSKLLDISREDSHKSKTDNIFENNISSSNAIISESKTYAKVKVINFVGKIQNVSTSEKSIEHIDTLLHQTPIKEDVNEAKMYLKSKNSQTESQPIETDSKTVIKRKIRSESLDRNISLIKKSKKNEVNVSSKKIVADSTIGSSHYEMLSDNELVYTANGRNEESTKCMIKERGSSKFLKQIRERHRKKNNVKIMKIRAKFHECFRGNFDTDTSESEEEREILLNLKKNKQQFDEPLHNSITEEKVEYIFERNKLTHDLSANNWQKNIESTIPDKIRSDNLYDSIPSDKEYALHDTVTEKQIEDSASLNKYAILTNNSQESTENINLDNLCDSSTYAEKFDNVSDAIIDEEMPSTCKRISSSVDASQKNVDSIYSDISCDSDACTEKYSPSNVTIDEEIEEALVCEHGMSHNNSQENVKDKKDAISNKVKFKNSNDSSTYKEKYVTKEKNIQDEATVYNYDMSTNNSQENMDVSAEIISDNSSDLSNCTEKYCATNVIVTRKEIKNKTLICINNTLTNHVNNSQGNIENAILAEAKSDNLGNFIARIKKCDITIKKKINHDESINDESICMLPDNSQKNIESAISLEVMADNSCNSTVNTGKYIKHNTVTDEKKDGVSSIYKHSISNDSQEYIESTIPAEVNFDNSISNIEKYSTHNIITDEKTEDGASTYKCDTPVNNSQENVKNIIPIEVQFDNSCDSECEIHSTVNVEKYDSMYDTAKDKVKNRTSICEHNMSDNESKNIGNVVSAEKEDIQNSSSTDTENNSKCDISAKHNIPSMIEINLDENMSIENIYLNKNIKKKADTTCKEAEEVSVQNLQKNQEMRNVESINLAQHKNMQKNANLELLIMSTFETTSYNVDKKDNRDMLEKNVKNLSNNNNIVKDEKTIDQFSMITSKLKKNSSEEKSNDSFFILPSNSSNKSNYSDNCSLDIHLTDDDNSSDIEVEIKIKPKLKSRVSRKFSLKAPWSAVNTCIKNLHTLKDNPSFLNELLQMDHKTSEKFNRKVTNTKEKKNDTSLDNVTAETDEIICNSSPTKDNENHSQQRNSQDRPILNEDKNMIAYDDKKEKNECTQSLIQTTPIITENNLDSSRLACDTSDLGKQSQKVVANDKQKNNEEQNFQDKTTLEGTKNVMKHNQVKEDEILFVERKKPQITTKNSLESIKAADDSPDVAEPQTSSNMAHKKVRVRSIAELSYQCIEKSVNLTASIPRSVCSTVCQSVSQSTTVHSISSQLAPQSTSRLAPQSTSFQSAPQSMFFQSAPSQSIAFQPILPQSTYPQLGHPSLVPPRFIFPQSTSQSVSKRPSPLSHNPTLKHTYLSPNTGSAVALVEVNTPNNNTLKNLIQITIKNICTNIGYCRNLDQYNYVRINFLEDYIQKLSLIMQQINQDLENLKMWLCMKNIDNTLIYVNFYMPKNHPVTVPELHKYMQICYNYLHISQQNYANTSQYPNINRLLSNASMSNVDAQQFSRNASFPDTRMLNRDIFMQSSTMPCPAPTISNINQQQLVRNSANSTQVPHSRQPRPNIHQSYMSYVPFTAQSRMPNANQQQSLENANHPTQGRYMPANTLNAGVQQDFLIVNNISSSNVNMRLCEPVNQGNSNVSPTTNMRQLHILQKNTSSNIATVSAANNVQQQKQMYLQTSQINSRTAVYPSPMTNQNNSFVVRQTVPGCDNVNLSGSCTINPDTSRINAAMENVRHGNINVNRQQASCSPQVSQISSGKTQYLPQYNPNQTNLIVAQSAHSNTQTHPVQNTLPNQNVWQIQQQQLVVNHGNTNIPPTTNRKQPYIIRNVISNTTTDKSQRYILPKDTSTCPIDLSINDLPQNVQQNMSQQKLPVNQRNANMPTINTKQSHMTSKNPINNTTITSQYVISKDRSIYPINLSINNTLQNVQENVLNKGEMAESQNTNRMQKKAQSMNLQRDTHQEILNVCDKLQNVDTVSENTRFSTQRLSILQSMMSTISPNKNDAMLFLSAIERKKERNKVMFSNNLASLTDIQKILLRDQIKSYFIMWDELKNLLSKQEFERVHNERIILFYSYVNVDDYIKSIINESQTVKKSVEKSSQNNMSQTKSTLQEGTIQTSEDKLTKTQLNQDNENNLECNRISEKQSEQSIDSNTSKSPKSTAIKSNLEALNEESLCTSMITKKFYPKDNTRLQEQDNNILKKQFRKGSLIDTEKEPQNTETLSPEEKLITEVSAKNLKTKTQYNAKINESLKVINSYDPSLKQNLLFNLLQDMPTKNIKDRLEIMINNRNKRFSNVEMESVRETSDIVILNSSKQNDGISRAQYNMEDQNKIIHNTNNEISSKNLRDGMRDDVKANTEILNSTKIQSDSLNILHISEPFPSNNIQESISPRKYLGKKCESTEISEPHITDEEYAEVTSEFCLNIQQQDPTNERSNDSTESFGKLYIDENMEMQTQCDKMSFEENNLKSQDSVELLDMISCDSTKVTSFSFLKNTAKTDLFDTYQDFKTETQYIEELDEHQSLEIEKMQLQDVSLKFEDECNVRESVIQSTNIIKKYEDTTKENNELLITEEIEFQEMSSNREVSKDTLHVEKSMTESIYLKYPEDIEEKNMEINVQKLPEDIEQEKMETNAQKLLEDIEKEIDTYTIIKMDNKNREQSLLKIEEVEFQKMSSKFRDPEDISSIEDNSTESVYFQLPAAIEEETINIDTQELKYIEKKKTKMDTHSGIKAINKQLKHVSEQKYRKSRTHALNSFQRDDFLDVNKKEISAKFSATDFLDADDIEYISLKSDDSNSMPSILNIRSISPSSFEKIKNINAFLENNSESLTKNDETSLDINDNLGISDEIDDRLCLRCKRKSMVYCQACLEAHYCSKRCSSLHWNAEHYKQCKGRNAIICIDE